MSKPKEIIVVDEAGILFSNELDSRAGSGYVAAPKRAISLVRFLERGIIAGAQTPSEITDSLKQNHAICVAFATPNPKEAREAQQLLGLGEEAIPELQSLPVGVAFVRAPGFRRAVKIQTVYQNLDPYPSDEQVAKEMEQERSWLEQHSTFSNKADDSKPALRLDPAAPSAPPASPRGPARTPAFFEEHLQFLRQVAQHPDKGTVEHYEQLGWSRGRCNRVKSELINQGLLESHRARVTHGRPPEVLVLTEKGKALL